MSKLEYISFHLVDDNDIDLAVNSKLLEIAKISNKIVTYQSALLLLDYLKSDKFDGSKPHVILLDIMMPNMNGFECLDQLTQMPEHIRKQLTVFMVSSSIDRNDIKKAESYDLVEKILEKPLDVYLLKKYLGEVFE
ncbi:MAG TPA: response regulator [Flavobacteriales bacterium]|jgi:CheY-like chemotaxis protein